LYISIVAIILYLYALHSPATVAGGVV